MESTPGMVEPLISEKMKLRELNVSELLKQGDINQAVKASKKIRPFRLTGILGDFPLDVIESFMSEMDKVKAADVMNQFPEEFAGDLIMSMEGDIILEIFSEMTSDEAVDFFPYITEEKKELILSSYTKKVRKDVETLAQYPEDIVGAHMEQDFISAYKDTTVRKALRIVRDAPEEIEHTDYIYITEEDRTLLGLVTFKQLMFSPRNKKMEEIMKTSISSANVDDRAQEIAQRLRTRRFKMFPVVDNKNKLIGVITLDTAADLLSTEIAEEFVSFSGTIGEESFFTRPKKAIGMRLPWMTANIFLNLGAVSIISSFEYTIESIAILAAFLPMITDMGGNVGIQALSVSIRSLSLGETHFRDIFKSIKKEIAIGLVNGLALGTLFGILAYIFQRNIVLSFVAGTALGVNVILAGIIGGSMPFIIKKFGKDPAMMTGPVLTTITDMTGVTIYLGLSTVFLVYML